MRDGLYRVHFQTPLGWGAGIIHAVGGRLWGGDAALYYTGSYQQSGDDVTAEVTTGRHTQIAGIASVFGRDQVRVTLSGVSSGDVIKLQGRAAEVPEFPFAAELTRIGD